MLQAVKVWQFFYNNLFFERKKVYLCQKTELFDKQNDVL